ncbi:MAG: hypothetical protein VB084_06150 [Syntrophomonadaceae bacterium]|nr:hypothetical protein [Syntrophomonadaceae bacterium]
MSDVIKLSPLGKTWILDLDGTLVKHNGYKLDGHDALLPGVREFIDGIPAEDMIIIMTSRTKEQAEFTEAFLREEHIRYDLIIYCAPYGERILINDKKTSGLKTAIAVNLERNCFYGTRFEVDETL